MAYETGTATNHSDLFAKLKTFLTTNAALVSAGQNWSQVWSAPTGAPNMTDCVLSGPGLAGTESIMVGLSLVADVPEDSYYIAARGMTGWLPEGIGIGDHINRSSLVGMYVDSNPMTYWFVANGRRFVAVVKISTVFEAMYGGLFLPYSTPTQYPYPLFIGGSRGDVVLSPPNWRSVLSDHTHFISPSTGTFPNRDSQAWMLDPAGQWIRGYNSGNDLGSPKIGIAPEQFFDGMLVSKLGTGSNYGYDYVRQRTTQGYGGSYMLTPVTLVQQTPTDQTFGVLQGIYRVPGILNAAENIITVGGVDHLVVQNCFRAGTGDYWALALV